MLAGACLLWLALVVVLTVTGASSCLFAMVGPGCGVDSGWCLFAMVGSGCGVDGAWCWLVPVQYGWPWLWY